MVKKVKQIESQMKDEQNGAVSKELGASSGSGDRKDGAKVIKTKTHIYVQDNDINLSDLEDED